jgi:hypothetical protein
MVLTHKVSKAAAISAIEIISIVSYEGTVTN